LGINRVGANARLTRMPNLGSAMRVVQELLSAALHGERFD